MLKSSCGGCLVRGTALEHFAAVWHPTGRERQPRGMDLACCWAADSFEGLGAETHSVDAQKIVTYSGKSKGRCESVRFNC